MVKPVDPESITGVWTYLSAIEWTEPWLMSILVFHAVCFVTILLSRNRGSLQALIFFPLLLIVFFSESINTWASKNWRMFSSEQYFDSQGVFISAILSGPILLNCLIIAMMWVYFSGELMVKVKSAQLRRAREKRTDEADGKKEQ